jgi:hypothetical protein
MSSQGQHNEIYLQQIHMISIKNISNSLVVINKNTFDTLSLSGPVINLHEKKGSYLSIFYVSSNTFSYIHSYLATNAIHVLREIDDSSDLGTMVPVYWYFYGETLRRLLYSSQIHI